MATTEQTWVRPTPGRLRSAGALGLVALGLMVGVSAGVPVDSEAAVRSADVPAAQATPATSADELAALEARTARVVGAWADMATYYDGEIAPIERVLLRYNQDPGLAQRIAVTLVREANAVGIEPRLLLAVLLVENPWLKPTARSPVGAIGLMQVMPVHQGGWGCGTDLEDIDVNICHGARIFAHYYERSRGDLDRALLRYNGCVNGTNTPDCHQYPNHVFANAGRASVMAWMNAGVVVGSP